ncbi:unnamed protein product, partial [Ixodes persulcatus]
CGPPCLIFSPHPCSWATGAFCMGFEAVVSSFYWDGQVCRADSQGGAPSETPRGSWASSVFDLRNSEADPLLPSLLERTPPEELDRRNALLRQESRHDALFELYPCQDEEEIVERRLPADLPREHLGHRILVRCLALKLELEIEPIFGSMALYDAKEKKKVSENFYFDMNPEPLKRMLSSHVPYHDVSTLSRACIFNVTYPSTDLFLVVKLEKVLQGDINECAEPYMKDEKNKDKVRGNAVATCERLGKYRMPFAWTAVYLLNVLTGVNSLDRDGDSVGSGTLGEDLAPVHSPSTLRRKTAEARRRRGSLERRSGSEKRRSWSPDDFANGLDTFRPVTLTVTSFFKQESDKLRDDDLYKFLADLKRPGSVLKRLKSIPGGLCFNVPLRAGAKVKCTLTEQALIHNCFFNTRAEDEKEVVFVSLLSELRNIIKRKRRMLHSRKLRNSRKKHLNTYERCLSKTDRGAGPPTLRPGLLFRSGCSDFLNVAYKASKFHNLSPDFQDEVKVKLPARLTDRHHLFFTFYHISCQRKMEQTPTETPIGYTWFPLYHDGHLQTGDHMLPVMLEHPPASYSFLTPSVQIPNTKWVDGHKGLFDVSLHAASTVHPQVPPFPSFL